MTAQSETLEQTPILAKDFHYNVISDIGSFARNSGLIIDTTFLDTYLSEADDDQQDIRFLYGFLSGALTTAEAGAYFARLQPEQIHSMFYASFAMSDELKSGYSIFLSATWLEWYDMYHTSIDANHTPTWAPPEVNFEPRYTTTLLEFGVESDYKFRRLYRDLPVMTHEQREDCMRRIEAGIFAAKLLHYMLRDEPEPLNYGKNSKTPADQKVRMEEENRTTWLLAQKLMEQYGNEGYGKLTEELTVIRQDGEVAFADMFERNLRLIPLILFKAGYLDNPSTRASNLQAGVLGHLHAIGKFDYTLGYKYSSYAKFWIINAVQRNIVEDVSTIQIPAGLQEIFTTAETVAVKLGIQHSEWQEDEVFKRTLLHTLSPRQIAFVESYPTGNDLVTKLTNLLAFSATRSPVLSLDAASTNHHGERAFVDTTIVSSENQYATEAVVDHHLLKEAFTLALAHFTQYEQIAIIRLTGIFPERRLSIQEARRSDAVIKNQPDLLERFIAHCKQDEFLKDLWYS